MEIIDSKFGYNNAIPLQSIWTQKPNYTDITHFSVRTNSMTDNTWVIKKKTHIEFNQTIPSLHKNRH